MIELPEAQTVARQIDADLRGKGIAAAQRGNSPHKFAFYTGSPEEYEATLVGRTICGAEAMGNHIVVAVEPDYVLALGCGGERILYHPDAQTLPKKHQLLLRFADNTYLTVSVQGWGAAQLVPREDLGARTYVDPGRVSPLGEAFTWEHYDGLFQDLEPKDSRSIKFFCISKPGIWGLGNGYLQDILYQAHVHPRRKAADLTPDERRALFDATVDVLRRATDLGGRDTERDLHNRPGGYRPALDRRMVGEPCPGCGTPIAKIQFQGGSCYFCPDCQPL